VSVRHNETRLWFHPAAATVAAKKAALEYTSFLPRYRHSYTGISFLGWIFCAGVFIPAERIFYARIYVLTEYFVFGLFLLKEYCILEYTYWLNILYWTILTGRIIYAGTFLWTEYFVLEDPYWLDILYWNIPLGRIFYTGIFLLTEHFIPWLNIWHWNISLDWIFCSYVPGGRLTPSGTRVTSTAS
jgi:hypothetical protein